LGLLFLQTHQLFLVFLFNAAHFVLLRQNYTQITGLG